MTCITKFFSTSFNDTVFSCRYLLIFCFIFIGVVAGVIASNIGPLTSQEEYLPRDDPLMVLQNEVETNFVTLGSFLSAANMRGNIYVSLCWGVKGLNRD